MPRDKNTSFTNNDSLIEIFAEEIQTPIQIRNINNEKNIVILFPMTRSLESNSTRWQSLITTANSSDVGTLVLIDKTASYQATRYFAERQAGIKPHVVILQRPRTEPTHDSQRLIKLDAGLWIIQMHDDDDWEGSLTIPKTSNLNTIFRTNFSLVGPDGTLNAENSDWPDCRSIFSLLPSDVWNRFAALISAQGGHVAGSIDSSLNIAASLIRPQELVQNFRYIYDNRHWQSKKLSRQHLAKLTIEDGWGEFSTVEISLVSRVIDGLSSLMFFSDFYSRSALHAQLDCWIRATKPNMLKIPVKQLTIFVLILLEYLLQVSRIAPKLGSIIHSRIIYHRILLWAWRAKNLNDYLKIIEVLHSLDFLKRLKPRFDFWKTQLSIDRPLK
jgi:hypothetical protein